jgi:hypothetical protein
MSLPSRQQRVIDSMEIALAASEPQLASMFAIFAQLNEGHLVSAEPLERTRRRWRPPGHALYAIVLLPVMFAAVIIGAMLGGSTRSTGSCDVGYSAGGGAPVLGRSTCPTATVVARRVSARCAAGTSLSSPSTPPTRSTPSTPSAPSASAGSARPVAAGRFVTGTGVDQVLSSPPRANAATVDASGMC